MTELTADQADAIDEEAYIEACEVVGPNSEEFIDLQEKIIDRLYAQKLSELDKGLEGLTGLVIPDDGIEDL